MTAKEWIKDNNVCITSVSIMSCKYGEFDPQLVAPECLLNMMENYAEFKIAEYKQSQQPDLPQTNEAGDNLADDYGGKND